MERLHRCGLTSALVRHAPALGLLAAIAILLTFPAWAGFGTLFPGAPTGDGPDHLWGYWWVHRALSTGVSPLHTTLSHWPPGGALWFIDPLGGLLAAPLQYVLPVAGATTVVVTLQLWGGMAAMYAVTRAQGPDRALLAAVIFGASPYALSLVFSGTFEYLNLAPLPLFWAASLRAQHTGGRWTWAAAALWLWALLGAVYYGAFAGLLWGIALVQTRAWRRAWTTPLLAGILVAPFLWLAWSTLHAPDAVVRPETAPGWSQASLPAVDPLTWVHPGDYYFPDNRLSGNFGILHVSYLGFVALGAAVWGLRGARELRGPLLIAAVLALGPALAWGGRPVHLGPWPGWLPAAILWAPGSPFAFVHHPFRLIVLPTLFLALAAARVPRLAPLLALGVLLETLVSSPARFPIPTTSAVPPTGYAEALVGATGVWDFPPGAHVENRRYEVWATVHGAPMPYGVNSWLPAAWAGNDYVRALLACLPDAMRQGVSREGVPAPRSFFRPADPARIPAARLALARAGYSHLVVHTEGLGATTRTCLGALTGPPAQTGAAFEVVRLDADPLSPPRDRSGP